MATKNLKIIYVDYVDYTITSRRTRLLHMYNFFYNINQSSGILKAQF